MAAVQISGAVWPSNTRSGRLGPYQDGSGNLWVIAYNGSAKPTAYMSSDGGATWGTSYSWSAAYAANYVLDSVFDSVNGVIYVICHQAAGGVITIASFTIATTTWAEVTTSGTRPTVNADGSGALIAFLTRRSTGEFVVFYQGPTHSLMGTPYRACYYARCSSAGVWSAGVETSGAVKLHHYDCKSAVLGASDRSHFFFLDGTTLSHRSVNSSNTLDTAGGVSPTQSSSGYANAYYNATLGKVVVRDQYTGTYGYAFRATSGGANPQTWTQDSNSFGDEDYTAPGPDAFIYEPTGAELYVFYRDANSGDVYQNSASGTTWGTAALQYGTAISQLTHDASTATGIVGATGTNEMVGQTFQLPTAISPLQIALWLYKIGTPTDNIYLDICADSGGSPGTVLATSAAVAAANVFIDPGTRQLFSFASPPSLAASTTYWLVVRRSGARDNSNYVVARGTTSDVYAGGACYYRSSGTWTVNGSTRDLYFEIPAHLTNLNGISVGLITNAIGVVFNDSGVYFDTLSLATGPTTVYGQVVSNFSASYTTQAQRKTFAQVALPFSASYTVQGRRKYLGQVALPFSASYVVSGRRRTTSSSVIAFSAGFVTQARRKTFAQIVSPFTATYVVSGTRKTFGSVSSPFSVTYVTSGIKTGGVTTYYGASVSAFTLGITIAAVRTTKSAVVLPLSTSYVTSGQRKTFSSIVSPFSVSYVTSGRRKVYAATVSPFIASYTTNAVRTTKGASVVAFSTSYVTSARKQTFGSIVWPISTAYVTSGRKVTFSAVALPFSLVFTTSGIRTGATATSVGRVSLSSGSVPVARTGHAIKIRARVTGGTGTIRAALYEGTNNRSGDLETSALTGSLAEYTLSIDEAHATAITNYSDLEIRFWGYSANGDLATFEIDQIWLVTPERSPVAQTHYGSVIMPLAASFTTQGQRKTFSATVLSFAATYVTSGQRKTFAVVILPLAASYVTSGQRKTFGAVVSPFTVGYVVSGFQSTGAITWYGAVVSPFAVGFVTSARKTTRGAVVFPLAATYASQGRRTALGQIVLPYVSTYVTQGRRKTFAQIVLPISASYVVAGRKTTRSAVVFPISAGYVVSGYSWRGVQTYYGAVVVPLTLGIVTQAKRKTFGQVVRPFSANYVTQAKRKTFSAVTQSYSTSYTTSARRTTHSRSTLPLAVTYVVSGMGWQGVPVYMHQPFARPDPSEIRLNAPHTDGQFSTPDPSGGFAKPDPDGQELTVPSPHPN